MLKLRKKQNGPADEIIDRSHYPIPPSLFFPFSETEFKRIHVVSPPCKGILDAYSISRLVSQDADDKPRKAEDC